MTIFTHIYNSRTLWNRKTTWNNGCIINNLIKSRNIFNVQTLNYDLMAVCATDLDPTGNFLLVGLSNGSVDIQGIQDPHFGTLDSISRLNLSPSNLHRVQWSPDDEQFFSTLDNHNLYFVDPVEMRAIDKFTFNLRTTWSDWNPTDKKIIAVCGTESQTRLVDIRSGSSVQTIILSANSRLASHHATRCLWSRQDLNCLIVGDNEGYIHIYDTRNSVKPLLMAGEEDCGQISGMSFTTDQSSIITSQGTGNHLVLWSYDKCSLRAWPSKFKKQPKEDKNNKSKATAENNAGQQVSSNQNSSQPSTSSKARKALTKKTSMRKHINWHRQPPSDAYIRCQFYVTDRHVYCPVPTGVTKSKVLYIYDLDTGYRIKTLKSDDIVSGGVYSVTGLLPDSLVLYAGGRARLRVWSLDEDYQRKLEEKKAMFHKTTWDSGDEL